MIDLLRAGHDVSDSHHCSICGIHTDGSNCTTVVNPFYHKPGSLELEVMELCQYSYLPQIGKGLLTIINQQSIQIKWNNIIGSKLWE